MNRKKQMQTLAQCKPDPYHAQWIDIRLTLISLDRMSHRLTILDFLILTRQPIHKASTRTWVTGSTFDAVQHCTDHEKDIQVFRQPTQQAELAKNISNRTIRTVLYG